MANSSGVQKPEEAEKQWAYVASAHSDWDMPDITKLNKMVAPEEANAARLQAVQELASCGLLVANKSNNNHCIIC